MLKIIVYYTFYSIFVEIIKQNIMKNTIIYDVLINSFKEDFLIVILGVISWLILLALTFLIIFGSLFLIDSVGLKQQQGIGIIIEKKFEPKHISNNYIIVGKTVIPQTNVYKNSWKAKIKINGLTDDFSFSEIDWNNLYINKKMNCIYTNGRIFNTIYIKNVK